jgi:hypothetical protein
MRNTNGNTWRINLPDNGAQYKIRKRCFWCALALAIVVVGCSGSRQFVALPGIGTGVVNGKLGRIYVVHVHGSGRYPVVDGIKVIGELDNDCYLGWDREPGTANLVSGFGFVPLKTGAGLFGGGTAIPHDPSMEFTIDGKRRTIVEPVSRNVRVDAGKTYYLTLTGPSGFSSKPVEIERLDEAHGAALIAKSKKARVDVLNTE